MTRARHLRRRRLRAITCPIGVRRHAIRSKEPGAIAVAVAAELLQVRERRARVGADVRVVETRLADTGRRG